MQRQNLFALLLGLVAFLGPLAGSSYIVEKDKIGFYEKPIQTVTHQPPKQHARGKCATSDYTPPSGLFSTTSGLQGCCILEHSDVLALYAQTIDYCVKAVEKKQMLKDSKMVH